MAPLFFLPVFAMPLLMGSEWQKQGEAPDAIEYRHNVYVSLTALSQLLDGTAAFADTTQPLGLQPLVLTSEQGSWLFPNGGNRVRSGDNPETNLAFPVLVHQGQHYVETREFEKVVGYTVDTAPQLTLRHKGRSLTLDPVRIDSSYQRHSVRDLAPVDRTVRTTATLEARTSLHTDDVHHIQKGTNLVVRRTANVDGTPVVIITDCGPTFKSYIANAEAVSARTEAVSTQGTDWALVRAWFEHEAERGQALCRGPQAKLDRAACLTVDLCWSLRPFEPDLLELFEAAARGEKPMAAVLFVSGRWTEQHPSEMDTLIHLSHRTGLDITWGLHSFEHPKTGQFMNDFTRDRLRNDTITQESQMLEWGIVPSAYYRFPGLIHDSERIKTILDLSLFPIDCDSWCAIAERESTKRVKSQFGNEVTSGSVILIHGNGNEPSGIPPFRRWVSQHPSWTLAPIHRFLPVESN